jgi:hypothetical protein
MNIKCPPNMLKKFLQSALCVHIYLYKYECIKHMDMQFLSQHKIGKKNCNSGVQSFMDES